MNKFFNESTILPKSPSTFGRSSRKKERKKKKTEKRRKIFLDVLQNIYDQRQIAFFFLLQHGRLMSKKFVLMQTSNP